MESRKRARKYVLDSSALIGGINPADLKGESYISPLVEKETHGNPMIKARIGCAIEEGKLIIRQPRERSVEKVKESAQMLGETVLSRADLETIALALELNEEGYEPILVSDDYSVENLCESLNLRYNSLITMGIERLFKWVYYCPGCGKESSSHGVCHICGTPFKRKAKPTREIQHREGRVGRGMN
ncbi:MAG: NOB1 family endonuclease [Candidatus Bathyarchaeia archaeon]